MAKKKNTTNLEKLGKYWTATKQGVTKGYKDFQKGAANVSKASTKLGESLSSSGEAIGQSFGAPNQNVVYVDRATGQVIPKPNPTIPPKVIYVDKTAPKIIYKQRQPIETYKPKGYKKSLKFGWGGY